MMGADEESLGRDLAARIGEPVREVRAIPTGHSGFTYRVELEGRRAVLRLPPPGARIAGPADIPRQGRIMAALHAQGLPVPPVLASSAEPVVGGRPFVLMGELAGDGIEEAMSAGGDVIRLAGSAVEVLRRLQAVPAASTGIAGESPMSNTAELGRWAWLMARAPAELTGSAPRLARRLEETSPAPRPPVMVHGDYHFGNMLFGAGCVVGVLDWEIAQLGQPLLDLCCLGVVHEPGHLESEAGTAGGWGVPHERLLAMFGADADEIRWPLALTYYKYAAIFGYNLMLHRRGKRPDATYELRVDTIVSFIERGIGVLG
ncbi:MAG: phosphotransferase family protein [Candidatus Dormibacteraceae bacterium]